MNASVVGFPERLFKPQYDKLEPVLNEAGKDPASLFELAKIGIRTIEAYQRGDLDTHAVHQGVINAAFLAFAALGRILGLIEPDSTTEEPPSSA